MTRAVERERAGRRDPAAVGDVASELARDLEREREPGRRAADATEVDVDVERQLDLRVLVDEDADDRPRRVRRARDRAHRDVDRLAVAPHA